MRRRDLLSLCTSGAGLAVTAACGKRQPGAKIRVGGMKRLSASNLYMAQESGYFREARLEIEVVPIDTPSESTVLIGGGQLDVLCRAVEVGWLNAVIRGLPMKAVAAREFASPSCGAAGSIYGLRRTFPRGLADLKQLKGKRVAIGPAIGYTQFALDTHLERAGLSPADVNVVSLRMAQAVGALIGGSVDAVVISDEFERDLRTLVADTVRSPGLAYYYPNMQYSYVYFGPTLLEADPSLGARFLSAYLRGTRDFIGGKTPRYMVEYASKNGLDLEQAVRACRGNLSPDGVIDGESLRRYSEWAARRKYTPRSVAVAELVDYRFLRRARAS